MQMHISSTNFGLTDGILGHIRRRLGEGLSHMAPRVRGVKVRIGDINGPRGGVDKRCHVEVSAPHVGRVCADKVDTDLYRAVDRAVDRLRTQLSKLIQKRRDRVRRASVRTFPE